MKARDLGLTTGSKRMAGKGERILLVGAGGAEGWEECEVIKMSKQKGNYNFYGQQLLITATTFLYSYN